MPKRIEPLLPWVTRDQNREYAPDVFDLLDKINQIVGAVNALIDKLGQERAYPTTTPPRSPHDAPHGISTCDLVGNADRPDHGTTHEGTES